LATVRWPALFNVVVGDVDPGRRPSSVGRKSTGKKGSLVIADVTSPARFSRQWLILFVLLGAGSCCPSIARF
jgi:hypothetical protein